MNQSYTSITNHSSNNSFNSYDGTTSQGDNNQLIHATNNTKSGTYAGEREVIMKQYANYTELGRNNGAANYVTTIPVKIALDHGWSSIKGEHIFMENGVVPVAVNQITVDGLLEYRGKKYVIGQNRLGKQASKTENENYFLLTLAGIAKELQYQGKTDTQHIELYAGVPLTYFGVERKPFRDYIWHKERVSYTYEGIQYNFFIDKVMIYAQCYAAIANRMGDIDRLKCIDLGSWTMDILKVKDGVPVTYEAYTYELGLINMMERVKKDGIPVVNAEITADDITDVILGKEARVSADFIPVIKAGLQRYADEVESRLRELKVDLVHENIVYAGGGAVVMKQYGRTKGRNIQYVTDVKANAIGYRFLADNLN